MSLSDTSTRRFDPLASRSAAGQLVGDAAARLILTIICGGIFAFYTALYLGPFRRRGRHLDFLRVLDFGLVKSQTSLTADDTKLTADDAISGTPAYLSPESLGRVAAAPAPRRRGRSPFRFNDLGSRRVPWASSHTNGR